MTASDRRAHALPTICKYDGEFCHQQTTAWWIVEREPEKYALLPLELLMPICTKVLGHGILVVIWCMQRLNIHLRTAARAPRPLRPKLAESGRGSSAWRAFFGPTEGNNKEMIRHSQIKLVEQKEQDNEQTH